MSLSLSTAFVSLMGDLFIWPARCEKNAHREWKQMSSNENEGAWKMDQVLFIVWKALTCTREGNWTPQLPVQ